MMRCKQRQRTSYTSSTKLAEAGSGFNILSIKYQLMLVIYYISTLIYCKRLANVIFYNFKHFLALSDATEH